MIKYKLACGDCNETFDSWFASSKEYDKLKNKKLLTCHICNSERVEKSLMAPKLIHSKNKKKNNSDLIKLEMIKKTVKGYQKFIKDNFKNVGENFAYEARSIHYDKKENIKGIYGKASKKDIQELKEEGIETHSFPWLKEKDN
jgi:hypothetical protein